MELSGTERESYNPLEFSGDKAPMRATRGPYLRLLDKNDECVHRNPVPLAEGDCECINIACINSLW